MDAVFGANVAASEPSYSDFTSNQKWTLDLLVVIFCSISMVGAMFIIISYGLFAYVNRKRKNAFDQLATKQIPAESSLILSMAISNVIQHTNQLIGAIYSLRSPKETWMVADRASCKIEAFVEQLFPLSTAFWALCIAITMYRLIVLKTSSETLYKIFHVISWGIPLLLAFVALGADMYGPAGNWCWISNNRKQILMQYLEMVLIFATICAIYVRVLAYVIHHRGVGDRVMRKRQRQAVMRIAWFPFVFILSWSGGLVNRLHNLFAEEESYALNVLMYITIPSMGWLNAIAYAATNNDIRQMYGEIFRGMCGAQEGDVLRHVDTIDAALLPPSMRAALNLDQGNTRTGGIDSNNRTPTPLSARTRFSQRSTSTGSGDERRLMDLLSSPDFDDEEDPYTPPPMSYEEVISARRNKSTMKGSSSELLVRSPPTHSGETPLPPFQYD